LASHTGAIAHIWRYGTLTAVVVLLLALTPQAHFRRARGADWHGEFAYAHGDEVTYAAYVNALIEGRPRRSDPYTGRDESEGSPQAESYISIQFVPPFVVARAARLFGLDTAHAFFLLAVAASLACALTLLWLLMLLLGDARLAAAGTLAVLCLASANQVFNQVFHLGTTNNYLPFMRLYVPAAALPVFFAFVACVWLMLAREGRGALVAACGAGLAFALLVFSYFYLWTTAAAWTLALAALWLIARPAERRRLIARLSIVGIFVVAALAPYLVLLSRRASNTDAGLLLTRSFRPDLLRLPELVGAATLCALFGAARRGLLDWRDRASLFAAACALTPLIVFNQQVLTGRSLQPFHFGMFSANYVAMLGAFLCAALACRSWSAQKGSGKLIARFALVVAALAVASGALETYYACRTRLAGNVLRDEARPAALRLAALGRDPSTHMLDTRSVVFATDYTVADSLPTVAPQAVLWAPHMFNHPGVSIAEDHERLMRWLYFAGEDFAGADPARFDALDGRRKFLVASLISRERLNPNLRADWQPVSSAEARAALDEYAGYAATFTRERAAQLPISYVVVNAQDSFDWKNLDRWYERDAGERDGRFIIYRVRLR
jgi:hypothetical protein